MERKAPCSVTRRTQQTKRQRTQHPLVSRSFQQVADASKYKATYRGSQQGDTSYIPYRTSKPPARPDIQDDTASQPPRKARTQGETDAIPLRQPHRAFPWLRYLLAGAIIVYSLYAGYVNWVDPLLTTIHNQWHYGDARVSYTTMTIKGNVRDLVGIGYKGQVEVIILPDPKDPASKATIYIDPQPFHDARNRVVLLHPGYINSGDQFPDILVEIEGTQGVSPVLYGRSDGSFQWNMIPAKG